MKSKHRVALVTGAAGGIGLAIAHKLASQGNHTILVDRDARVTDIAKGMGAGASALVIDVSDEAAILDGMRTIEKRFGRCDVLVSNAGLHPKNKGAKFRIEEIDSAHWQQIIAVNLTAAFVLARESLSLMREHQWGRIVNVSSAGGRMASLVASAPYAASKAGLIGLTRVLALEGAADHITANCVAPGPIRSAMTNASSPEVREAFVNRVPLRRYGEPVEIASAVAYLVSDEAAFTTGAVIDINGGTYMP